MKCGNRDGDCTPKMFTSFHSTTKYLFLNVYDPGYPDELDNCTSGITHVVGSAMWYLYYFLVAIVLINLLIALMNTTLNNIESIDTWMYHRTVLWMRFCNKSAVVLPPPINLINYMLTEVKCLKWCRPDEDVPDSVEHENEYQKLMDELVTRYTNDMNTFDDNDIAMRDQLEHLERVVEKSRQEINELKDKLNRILTAVER